jgi:NAD(P)-dependent dehydrogenase (short-subunit alcohol dehydrogenase family)
MPWTTADIPDQSGRVAIVTGANSGIGFWTAHRLAEAGALVVLACRSEEKAAEAKQRIDSTVGAVRTTLLPLDLSRLGSVRAFAHRFLATHDRLDLLINNAGVMIPPHSLTEDGFELQLGTNHMGHFALTGLLIERLLSTPDGRIVNVSSSAHKMGQIDFEDLDSAQRYKPWVAYGRSKLANLLHILELDRPSGPGRTPGLRRHQSAVPVLAHPDDESHCGPVSRRWGPAHAPGRD